MIRTKRPGFSIVDAFVVHPSRDLPFNGKTYVRGTIFPWKEASCTARRLNLLYKARKILSELELSEPAGDTLILEDIVKPDIENNKELIEQKTDKELTKTESEKTDKELTKTESDAPKRKRSKRKNKDKNDKKDNNKTTKPRSRKKLTKPRS